jgi:hypothetical protein
MFDQFRSDILTVHDGVMSPTGDIDEAKWLNNIKRAPFRRVMPNKPYNGWKFFVLGDAETRTVVNFFWDDGLVINAKKCASHPCKFGGASVQLLLEPVKTTKLHLAVDRLV